MEREYKMIVLPQDGGSLMFTRRHPSAPLEILQQIVGGNIETVPCTIPCDGIDAESLVMVLNEEGKLRNMEENELATAVSGMWGNDVLVGNAVILGVKGDELVCLKAEDAELIREVWL